MFSLSIKKYVLQHSITFSFSSSLKIIRILQCLFFQCLFSPLPPYLHKARPGALVADTVDGAAHINVNEVDVELVLDQLCAATEDVAL